MLPALYCLSLNALIMGGGVSECTEGLVGEIRELKALNSRLLAENNTLRGRLHSTESALCASQEKAENLRRENGTLRDEAGLLRKRNAEALKRAEVEARRCDTVWTGYRGSSRTRQASMAGRRIAELRNTNSALNALLVRFGRKYGFDNEVAEELCSIADGANDPLIGLLVDDEHDAYPGKENIVDGKNEDQKADRPQNGFGRENQDKHDVSYKGAGAFEKEVMKE